MSLLDPAFRYHGEATHETSLAFRRRQQERMRQADAERAKAQAADAAAAAKVQPMIAAKARKAQA